MKELQASVHFYTSFVCESYSRLCHYLILTKLSSYIKLNCIHGVVSNSTVTAKRLSREQEPSYESSFYDVLKISILCGCICMFKILDFPLSEVNAIFHTK